MAVPPAVHWIVRSARSVPAKLPAALKSRRLCVPHQV